MGGWQEVRAIPIGGLVAVGFLDEGRIVVGSHSGLSIVDATTGNRLDHVEDLDGEYGWFRQSPPTAVYRDNDGEHHVEVEGLWGGDLRDTTDDGWAYRERSAGAVLSGPSGVEIAVDDDDEARVCGFSPKGQVFVYATSATLYVAVRSAG